MIYLNKGTTGLPVAGAAAAQQPAEGDGQGRPAIGENMVLNAQGGVALDEFAEGPADWLDIFFFFARLSSLFFFFIATFPLPSLISYFTKYTVYLYKHFVWISLFPLLRLVILFAVVYASVSWEKWLVSLLLLFFLYVRQVGVAPLRRLLGRRAPAVAEPAPAPAAPPAPPAAAAPPPQQPGAGQQGSGATNQQPPSTSTTTSSSTSASASASVSTEAQSEAARSTSPPVQVQPQQQAPTPAAVVREPAGRRLLQTGAQFVLAFVSSLFPAHTVDQQPAAADAAPNNQQRNQEQRANPAAAAQ